MTQTAFVSHTPVRGLAMVGKSLRLSRLMDLWRSRQALSRLDDAALRDIGLAAKEAHREASRPVWDVPANWRV